MRRSPRVFYGVTQRPPPQKLTPLFLHKLTPLFLGKRVEFLGKEWSEFLGKEWSQFLGRWPLCTTVVFTTLLTHSLLAGRRWLYSNEQVGDALR